MRCIAFDTETALSIPGLSQPPIACMTWAERQQGAIKADIVVGKENIARLYESWVRDPNVLLVGHEVRYDTTGVCNETNSLLPATFEAYEKGRITDTLLRQQLFDLSRGCLSDNAASGPYGLAKVVKNIFEVDLDKHEWRYSYGKLIGVPLHAWPEGAKKYAVDDAVWTLRLFEWQQEQGFASGYLKNDTFQAAAGFTHQLMSNWGMRTDPQLGTRLRDDMEHRYQELLLGLKNSKDSLGRSVIRTDGTQDTKFTQELVAQSYQEGEVPVTATGKVSTAAEIIAKCTHPFLQNLAEYKEIQKILKTFVPVVEQGMYVPINPRINTLLKNGRSSYASPNLQNLPRKGGIRECFVPRAGKVFVDADYDTLEVRTLAQVLYDLRIGETLVRQYNENPAFDPHVRLAAQMLHMSEQQALSLKATGDERIKDTRQRAKCANFGYPGGMGWSTFIQYAKGYGLSLSRQEAKQLKRHWEHSIPEIKSYFKLITNIVERKNGELHQLRSGRVRGGCGFTDASNSYWSGLAADGVKAATFNVAKACYVEKSSPLFGSRPVVVVHDELILEAEDGSEHEVGTELSRIMQESMEKYTPNVPSRASAQAMRRWYKGAEPVYKQGRLVPWEPSDKVT